jgi:glycosyltransferase involved in cell wall biosynthesis
MSGESPLVCICIPTFNAERTIRESLQSILAQHYDNLIIHISDNASTDNTLEIVESMRDSRLRIHRNQTNVGAEGNFTRCIQLAMGKYTAIYHADDVYEPDIVERQVSFLEAHPDVGAVFTEATIINEINTTVGRLSFPHEIRGSGNLFSMEPLFKAILQYSNFLICPSAMLRGDIYRHEVGAWRGDLFGTSADLDVWLRVAMKHSIGLIPERLMRYRISQTQGTQALRARTTRSDFFRVIDHYLSHKEIKAFVTRTDLNNYAQLERTDKAVRAANIFLLKNNAQARALCRETISRDALKAALASRRGLITLLLAVYVAFCIDLRLAGLGRWFLRTLRCFVRK